MRHVTILRKQLKRGTAKELSKMDLIMKEDDMETGDFVVDEKEKTVNLTAQGVEKVERFFHIENLADPENLEIQHCIILALRAHNLMFRDKDYVVKDDEVLIVDEFTGRIMPGRRYSDGLHQAIEAKEHVKVKRESRTLATITFQNFFNKYNKKCGMTGTALTEEKEFREIYGMDVVEVPTNKPIARIDYNDSVYKTKREKLNAIVEDIADCYERKQPVLVGTITIEASEELSEMLKRRGIKHKVLNAKYHELEAEIIADAGVARCGDNRDEHGRTWYRYQTRRGRSGTWRTSVSLVPSVMSPDVSTISCVDVPDVREIQVNPSSTFPWKMT